MNKSNIKKSCHDLAPKLIFMQEKMSIYDFFFVFSLDLLIMIENIHIYQEQSFSISQRLETNSVTKWAGPNFLKLFWLCEINFSAMY